MSISILLHNFLLNMKNSFKLYIVENVLFQLPNHRYYVFFSSLKKLCMKFAKTDEIPVQHYKQN